MSIVNNIKTWYSFNCPHCDGVIEVYKKELRCKIFRHGLFIRNGVVTQIPPHTSKKGCDQFVANGLLEGCGKPFIFIESTPNRVEKCDYI